MDGRTAITSLRADSELRPIPIIVISVLPEREHVGGDAFFEKPIEEDHLLASARLLLHRDNGAPGTDKSAAQDYLVVSLPEKQTSLPAIPAGEDRIVHCRMEELDQRLVSGFSGMLVVPAECLEDLNLRHIFATSEVHGVIIDGSRSCAAGSVQEERVDGS